MATLTVRKLMALKAGEWVSDGGARGAGTLAARRLSRGAVLFYFRYVGTNGRREAIPVGQWSASGDNLSLERARNLADGLSTRYRNGDRDLRDVLAAEERERQRLRKADKEATQATSAKAAATLGTLLDGYVAQLKRDGKASAASVEGALQRHVAKAWPMLWRTPAADVAMDDLLPVIGRLADADKLREAAKLRSYIRAAYAAAIRARQDARGLAALRDLKITHNPARDLATIDGATQTRERALSVAELRAYWRRIRDLPGAAGALLRFHLLTGGQRVKQLSRLTMADFDADLQSIRIMDKKGRRKQARVHDVPLIPSAVEAMEMMGHELGSHLFTLSRGANPATYESMRDHVVIIRAEMEAAGELEKGPFTVGDLRRTVETRLSAAGLQPFEMAQLQSHGLGGVQARHYNRHDYFQEKRAALEMLHHLLTRKGDTVTMVKRLRTVK